MLKEWSEVNEFWFGSDSSNLLSEQSKWWKKDPLFDRFVCETFEPTLKAAGRGELEQWRDKPISCLAYIILLDQFSRNIFRDSSLAYAQDAKALKACLRALDRSYDEELNLVERWFLYMPLEHAEDIEMQQLSLKKFDILVKEAPAELVHQMQSTYDYAVLHFEVIEKFGRFPHRNKIVGRETTPDEVEFLKAPNFRF